MDGPVIELDDVSIAFGDNRVLDGLSLQILPGETTFIVGRGSSGKTTLLKVMMGLLTPDRGRVRLFGRDLATISEAERTELHRRTSMLFQNYALFDALSVEDNLEFPLVEVAGVPRPDARQQAQELLRTFGLAESEDVLPGELSGGMKKRLALARALVSRPDLALFDEPTTGLDPIMVEKIDEIIASQRSGMTTVIVNHDLASARRLADRVAFLHDGKIAFTGSLDDLERSTLPPIRAFLASAAPGRSSGAAPAAEHPVIQLVGVEKRFGDKHVLRSIDLSIFPHRITALIGASGSGKSVIAKHIMGLLQPDRGQVLVFGKDIVPMTEHELEAVRAHFGFVFQHAALLDWLNVEDNVAFPLVEHGRVSPPEIRARVQDLLERLGLAHLRYRMPDALAAGERKRVGVARAMVVQPDILIYDEPTTGQDPLRTHEIDDMIVQTQEQFPITTIVISHDMASTFRIAHTIAMIHDGKIVGYGTPAELSASKDPYVHHFLNASAVE